MVTSFRAVCFICLVAPFIYVGGVANNTAIFDYYPPLGKSPFRPSPIVDPSADIECDDFLCDKKDTCKDYPDRICAAYHPCKHKVCLHKALFPLLTQDCALLGSIFVISFLAGAPGIGGGGINVPILMILSSFDIKEAVPLSHIAVMGNAMSQMIMNTPRRHPEAPHRPLIHYEIAALLLPAMLGGNSLGVVVGRVFPPTLMIVFSLVLLALTATKTILKGCHIMHESQESRCIQPDAKPTNTRDVAPAPIVTCGTNPTANTSGASSTSSGETASAGRASTSSPDKEVAAEEGEAIQPRRSSGEWPKRAEDGIHRTWSGNVFIQGTARVADAPLLALPHEAAGQSEERMRIPWRVISFMVIFDILFCGDFLALSKDVSGIAKCSSLYWIALLGLYPVVGASLLFGVRMLQTLATYHADRGEHIPGDPVVNGRTVVLYPALAVLVGLMAGLLGLGGGEFLVPLLLEFGMHSRVASATSGFLIFFNTFSNVVHYLIAGTIEPFLGYGVACFCISAVGSMSGLMVGNLRYVQKKAYLIIFLVAFLLILSAGLLVYRGIFASDANWAFSPFCS